MSAHTLRTRLLMIALLLCACDGTTEPRSGEPLRIGAALSLTGSLSVEGNDVKRGYELWAAWVNIEHKGIVAGGRRHPVELVIVDDGSDAARAAQLVRRLVLEDSVDFLLGPYGSAATITTSVEADALGRIMIAGNGAADEIHTRGLRNTFSVLTPAREYTRAAMQTLAAKGARTVVLAQEEGGAFSISVAAGAAHWAQQFGMTVLATYNYPRGAADVTALITQARALAPDAFIGGGYFNDAVLFARTARKLGFTPRAMVLTVGPGSPEFITILRDTAELVLGPTQWESSMTWQGEYMGTPAQYAARYAAKFGSAPSYQAAQSTAAGLVLMHAIESAGSFDTDAVRNALKSLDLMTFYGPIRFDANGKNVAKPMGVVQVQNGKTVVVAPAEVAVASWLC